MKPEIKAKWVAALRSGEYKQASNYLKSSGGYCCLGVLCDLYAKDHSATWGDMEIDSNDADFHLFTVREDEFSKVYAPASVMTWAGLPIAVSLVIGGSSSDVSNHNDGVGHLSPRSFAEIADAIEAQL